MVFKFLLLGNARAALAQCSRVSKSWHTIAITVLWAHINLDWFRSLVRFERTADGIYESTLVSMDYFADDVVVPSRLSWTVEHHW